MSMDASASSDLPTSEASGGEAAAPLRILTAHASHDASSTALDHDAQLRYAREIIRLEGQALLNLARRLDDDFCLAADSLFRCRSSVIVTGMGKAGLIAQKIAATMASTGTRSHFLHPAEAFHGDLGRIHRDDVVLLLSQSGETEEVTQLLPSLAELGVTTIAITGKKNSTLARAATIVLELGPLKEACALGLAPSTSTTAMLALGDALALVASRMRNFQPEDFARFHPGGSLGQKLSNVEQYMRPLAECRVANQPDVVRDILQQRRIASRRSGAIMIVDGHGQLSGFFTDSDLARLFERRQNEALDGPIGDIMTSNPVTVPIGSMISDAMAILAERKISELPVVDADGKPVGLVDITDLVARGLPVTEAATGSPAKGDPSTGGNDKRGSHGVPKPKLLSSAKTRTTDGA